MARTKIDAIERTGARTVVSLDPSCLMQIQGALSRAGSQHPHHAPGRGPGEPLTLCPSNSIEKIHTTLADANLQLAIYTATGRLKEKRIDAVATDALPDYQELRTQANALKKHAIENLDYYLEEFERNVEAHGGKVVYCKDGTEVSDFVLALAKERGAQLIVKSKSMTTEEIDLNERLEHHGLESVETDLGEYILQLAHERPYHIVAPALHMTRYDVADIFTRELRVPNETVIEKQTAIARAVLREKFLAADIGISGANFLVADSGAVVMVENEGNARLTTSAPKIHIAVAGIEKVIPRAQDLAVVSEAAGAQRHRPAALGLHVVPERAAARGRNRRARRVLRGAAGQRPHQAAARSGQAPIALLHPLRRVPEHLPGVPQDRRPQFSVGVFGTDRRHHHAAVHGRGARAGPAVRLQPVRRVRAKSAR